MLSLAHRTPDLAFLAIVLVIGLTGCDRYVPEPPTQPDLSVSVQVPGTVLDPVGRGVAGVDVYLLSDPGARATTDANGAFNLSGQSASDRTVPIELRRQAYETLNLVLQAPTQGGLVRGAFRLVPVTLVELTGEYDLTVSADSRCTTLPAVARQRAYRASIASSAYPARFEVQLSGAALVPDTIGIDVASDAARAFVGSDGFLGGYAMVETLPSGASVQILGWAEGSVAPGDQTIVLPLRGTIQYCAQEEAVLCSLGGVPAASCSANTHQVTLARR